MKNVDCRSINMMETWRLNNLMFNLGLIMKIVDRMCLIDNFNFLVLRNKQLIDDECLLRSSGHVLLKSLL